MRTGIPHLLLRRRWSHTRRRLTWMLLAAAIVAGGLTLGIVSARRVAQDDAHASRDVLQRTAGAIATRLKLQLQEESDLLVSVAAYHEEFPHLGLAQYDRWLRELEARQRYPEMLGVAIVNQVPAAALPAWSAAAAHILHLPSTADFRIFPAGHRPYYCLVSDGWSRNGVDADNNIDFCALEPTAHRTLDTGVTSSFVLSLPGLGKLFGLFTPIYRGTAVPATVGARRARFLGWVASAIEPRVLLDLALAGHPGTRLTLDRLSGSRASVSGGAAPAGARSVTVDLHDGTVIVVSRAVAGASILAHRDALTTLISDIALSVLLAVLLAVLVTSRRRALTLVEEKTEQLAWQALHDPLTGLPNRLLVLDRAEQALVRARRTGQPVAVLFVDADGFKQVNDTLGHAAGDELLRVFANRLGSVLRESDTVGRLGGDEFVVLLEAQDLYVAPELIAERILEVLRQPVIIEGQSVLVSASIGIASGNRHDAEELLRDADLALYAAKAAGRDQYAFFESSMHAALADRFQLESDLREAIARDELFVMYQPTFDLATRRATGAEALVRWRHPERGLVVPDQFIPLAEETGLIVEIGGWVLQTACAQAAAWHASGYPMSISVNVSARQVERDDFVAVVEDVLARTALDPAFLTLEITETVLMRDPESSAVALSALKRLGVRIAIDDFGTGYSSLGYLRRLPVDALKIDRSFVSGGTATEESRALMATLVQLGRQLGLETFGEGIEDDHQLDSLRDARCDSGQGFLLARPLEAEAVERFFTWMAPAA